MSARGWHLEIPAAGALAGYGFIDKMFIDKFVDKRVIDEIINEAVLDVLIAHGHFINKRS